MNEEDTIEALRFLSFAKNARINPLTTKFPTEAKTYLEELGFNKERLYEYLDIEDPDEKLKKIWKGPKKTSEQLKKEEFLRDIKNFNKEETLKRIEKIIKERNIKESEESIKKPIKKITSSVTKENLENIRSNIVAISNNFIMDTRFKLSVLEMKIVDYVISFIKKDDLEIQWFKFKVADFIKVCGIANSGSNYLDIKNAIQSVRDKSWWVKEGRRYSALFAWFDSAVLDKETGDIDIKISEYLKPFVIGLKKDFTSIELRYLLSLKSKYSYKLYKMLKCNNYKHIFKIEVEELRKFLDCDSYPKYAFFKQKVLNPSTEEINGKTDLEVSVEKVGSYNISTVMFIVKNKNDKERLSNLIESVKFNNYESQKYNYQISASL